ncbi:MAG: two-component system response regulator OmpR [Chromatiales bacterium]|jgi:two-component system phosphate regulon response regulator OmpR|nr:two-component system response regulator OmpR [Chromatiales bacterium]MDX9766038.1 two-component system response regulator OmpR [Ectothiorhodospiraceae bacterium]
MNDRKPKILVVDDDLRLRDLLERYLDSQGFEVETVADAGAADRALSRARFDLMVLDLMLPGEDGLSILRRLRGRDEPLPIIMLTARGDDVDRIVGLELGADDYLPKPFNPRELTARIHAVLRRRPPSAPPGAPALESQPIRFGPFVLDLATRRLTRDGTPVALTTGEFALLKVLVSHPRQPLTRDQLMNQAKGREHEAYDRAVDVQVSRLRKLVEDDPSQPKHIQTVWGYGYVFVPDGDATAEGTT